MSKIYIKIADVDEFENFNLSSPQSNPFQSINWLKSYAEIFDFSINTILVKKGDETVAGLILPIKKKFSFKISTPLLFTYYSGILFKNFHREKPQKQITEINESIAKIHEYLSQTLHFFVLKLHHTILDTRQFKWLGYKIKPRHTFILNTESPERIWDGFSNSLKRKIKYAQEQGFEVKKSNTVDKLAEHQILSYERTGRKFFVNIEKLKLLLEKLVERNMLQVYHLIDKTGEIIASRGISIWGDKAYDIVAGTQNKEIDFASHFLVWKILEDLSNYGVKEFDFCGADIPSVSFFKMQFGGEIKVSFEVSYAKGFLKILTK
ncbi:GNAT family N-acetyltransferase [Candidatus Chrysopegis kryptomonas]|jgi:hypothetical protein|uniref:Acetyltransferase (GNAT) domain-containing protein n=1 Tax=Candidatus Chryseopegocella kryptomonas TaxID=1633643 RepID=A0A0P1MZL6_9BACT|nr:GNAT family N-acetyltransferase [Candidatus Chrysopegis kryptomonas]CUT01537.1 Acetyltransferase (GNAT) domain-containing protein [Candidatus Chrysopegis kryptomonas]